MLPGGLQVNSLCKIQNMSDDVESKRDKLSKRGILIQRSVAAKLLQPFALFLVIIRTMELRNGETSRDTPILHVLHVIIIILHCFQTKNTDSATRGGNSRYLPSYISW